MSPPVQYHHSLTPVFLLIGIAGFILSIWLGPWLYQKRPWEMVCVPIVLLVIVVVVMPVSAPVMMVGTFPVLMIDSIIAYRRPQIMLTGLTLVYAILWVIYLLTVGWWLALVTLQSFVFVILIVAYYWRLYQQQLSERQRVEDLYSELQLAYKQVEASAIRSERQRVARELHDTLTQGLAAVVMQLEAANSFLDQGNTKRAKEIINDSVTASRKALQESRITLTDLRSTTEESLPARLQLTTEAIQKNYHIHTTIKFGDIPDYAPSQLTEITRIVTEALTNVAKHAKTDQALISSQLKDDIFKLKVIDFGQGFNTKNKLKPGHYGLSGLQERATRLDGVVTVISSLGEGTTVTLTMPTSRKELDN
ncbi:sensor histidine kinase [Secundilactobacillus silagei]|nr:sensor histidine kinase [Secundilactobacillus silagei]